MFQAVNGANKTSETPVKKGKLFRLLRESCSSNSAKFLYYAPISHSMQAHSTAVEIYEQLLIM